MTTIHGGIVHIPKWQIRSLIEQDLIESFHFEVRNRSRYPTYAG